jgi:hypothetical protein
MKVTVKLTVGKRSYSEDVTDEQKEYFQGISTNGANKDIEGKTFDWWIRPITSKASDLEKYNTRDSNQHFIFGWFEGFIQSDNVPMWIYEAEEIDVEVLNEKND